MDKDTRNLIQRATQDARRLLETEYREQLEGLYDVLPDTGVIAQSPGAHLDSHGRFTRTRIVAAIHHERTKVSSDKEAIAAYLREASFTTVNRFAALKLMEARRIVQECVSKGDQSAGFREFSGLAPGLGDLPDRGYRLYLECLFDEVGVEVGALFDRRHPSGLLWPRRPALLELLEVLNRPTLTSVWSEDETLGWVYQYFNSKDERDAMRDTKNGGSAAPRNSRELAVRNQFFTPRYVVQFLTDNTLGRIWYEMLKGETVLKEECRYMVRRPHEIFLKPGETAPADSEDPQSEVQNPKSQEDLLQQPVHIPHRPLKDPREIRLLDPACGSMHFGLYAFDLYEKIYADAWDLAERMKADGNTAKQLESEYPEFSSFIAYAASFSARADFLRTVPRLILEHNIYGIDIDPRATQIAGFALWLRAQRSWAEQDVRPADRPAIEKTNIVCAEPMPGDRELLREFSKGLNPPFLGQIVEKVWDAMQLAGEAGSLLKIEEQIAQWVQESKKRWLSLPKPEQLTLFEPIATYSGKPARQEELPIDLSGITDERFWEEAEERIYDGLSDFAAHAVAGNLRQRLFANDAVSGFAYIDLCRIRYDIVVMNPPFGAPSRPSEDYIIKIYKLSKNDIYGCFIDAALRRRTNTGLVGAITSRTWMFLPRRQDIRIGVIDASSRVHCMADLGHGVLDTAMVETCAFCLAPADKSQPSTFFRLVDVSNEKKELLLQQILSGSTNDRRFEVVQDRFKLLPGSPFAYWISDSLFELLAAKSRFGDEWEIGPGLTTRNNDRFLRSPLEIPKQYLGKTWIWFAKGGAFSPYYFDTELVLNYESDGLQLKAWISSLGESVTTFIANQKFYFRAGFTYPRVTDKGFNVRVLRAGHIFAEKGISIFPKNGDCPSLGALAYLNSSLVQELLLLMAPSRSWEKTFVASLPAPRGDFDKLEASAKKIIGLLTTTLRRDPTSNLFVNLPIGTTLTEAFEQIRVSQDQASQEVRDEAKAVSALVRSEFDCTLEGDDQFLNDPWEAAFVIGDGGQYCSVLIEYLIGTLFGRWDLRIAIRKRQAPPDPGPFDPLPVCPPGMLQNATGFPAEPADLPKDFPLNITWSGIHIDDPGNSEDIEGRLRGLLTVIWGDQAESIENEACQLLGVSSLIVYIRKQFFTDHLKRYSKSRRQAPIYWPLSTPSGSYTIWLYYHRFNNDTFYRVREISDEKFQHEERKLFSLQQEAGPNPSTGQAKANAIQQQFVDELREFRAEVARVAALWKPNFNDGVIINFAPFHRLISHAKWRKDVTACWEKLVAGDYDWAHLAMHLWPERVVPKCASDRSLAIAHGLDEVFWEPDPEKEGKHRRKSVSHSEIERLVAERTSPAVKAALESLASAPVAAPRTKHRRKSRT